ncbi:MAG: hypothetical protein MJ198_01810 [Bacteroidales bacterium]|nr:hypothetical protein [Bacteroidales bacterium]
MRKLRYVILFACICISHHAVSQEFKQFFYPNGAISSEGYLTNGKPDGYWKSYYPDGSLKSIGKRTNFQLDSIWCFYDENKQLQKEISYFENKKNGFLKEYSLHDSLAYLSMTVLYVNDQKQGAEQYFDFQGNLIKEIHYVNNKKEGKSFEYQDTTIISILIYENDNLISNQPINRTDSKGQKTGQHISFYPNGAMKTDAVYNNGKLHGLYKLYNQHEQLMQVGNYENDSLIYSSTTLADFEDPFEKKEYYSDSTLKSKGAFRDKTPIGIHRIYDKKGNITDGALYDIHGTLIGQGITQENGDKYGKWIFFYPSGKKESEGFYENGLQSGSWTFFYPDETIKQKGNFRNGKYDGPWYFYNEVGDLQKEEEYSGGNRQGLSIEYDDEGEKILEGMYNNDLRQGFWSIQIGDLKTKGSYEFGEKNGLWESNYIKGGKAFRGDYVSGNPNGHHVYYYQNGQIEHDEQWRHGKAVKNWNYYNESGKLKYSVYYKDGNESRIVTPKK